jgi:hypothetical protein
MDEARQIQIWMAVELQFIANHLRDTLGRSAIPGDDVLRELRDGVLVRVWCKVGSFKMMRMLSTLRMRAFDELLDEFFRIDLFSSRLTISLAEAVYVRG